jgi:aspartokinase
MPTIAHLTRKIIEKKPFLEEALLEGIVNNAALAEKIIPEIEKELKKKVKFSAVNLAIRRMSENPELKKIVNLEFDKNTDISLKSNIFEIVLYKDEKIPEYIKKIYNLMDFKKGDFLTITQGFNEVMIITNEKHKNKIIDILPKKSVKKKINKLSTLTIEIPESSVESIGLFYILSKALNWENISLIDVVSTYTEITLIVKEDDASRAFDVLKKLIHSK